MKLLGNTTEIKYIHVKKINSKRSKKENKKVFLFVPFYCSLRVLVYILHLHDYLPKCVYVDVVETPMQKCVPFPVLRTFKSNLTHGAMEKKKVAYQVFRNLRLLHLIMVHSSEARSLLYWWQKLIYLYSQLLKSPWLNRVWSE